ncbi:MAG: hypothetical protein IJO52_09260 [Clostridia bacterium]|nr:hypothetical protein [Clostridia bacterium]
MERVNVILPKKFDIVVGDTFQLFYRGIIDAPNPYIYDILSACEKGRNCPRYFEFTPDCEGEYNLKISVFGAGKVLLGEAETKLVAKSPVQPTKPVSILCVGDSLTQGGEWAGEAMRRITAAGGTPKGDGLRDITFIGTCEKNGCRFEGYGGWRWESYYTKSPGAMWIVCNTHDKTIEDQHSLWQDENGYIWQIETLADDYNKFNRYLQHEGPIPTSGSKLTHYKNAVHTSPFVIESCYQEKLSPFYDTEKGEMDFVSYCTRNGFDKIDMLYIFLGANGRVEDYIAGLSVTQQAEKCAESAKLMARRLHRDYPEAKIRIVGLTLPSVNGGCGTNYGAHLPSCDWYEYTRFVLESNRVHQNWVLEEEFHGFADFVCVSAQFDTENSFPTAQKSVNTRSTKTEEIGINGAHPTYEGYMQIADAVYRNMIHTLSEF